MAATDSQTLGAANAVNSPPRYHDNGSGGKLLRPENQTPFQANVAVDANGTALAGAINGLRDDLIAAGIMKAS